MEFTREEPVGNDVCETCAERGRPNEPVYKMGMCEFCYKGWPHPNATREQLVRERAEQRTGQPPMHAARGAVSRQNHVFLR